MKFLLHFPDQNWDDFRNGMLFVEDDSKDKTEAENSEDLNKIPATKADIEEIKALLKKQQETGGLSDEDRKKLRALQQKAQNATNNLSGAVDDILSGKKISVPDEPETTEKTETKEKEAKDKVEDQANTIKNKVANATKEKTADENSDKIKTEEDATKDDAQKAQDLKDKINKEYNEHREHDSDLAGYKERQQFVKESKEKIDATADAIQNEKDKKWEQEEREELKEAGDYETAKLGGYNNFLKNLLDEPTRKLVKDLDTFRSETFKNLHGFKDRFAEVAANPNVLERREAYLELNKEFEEYVASLRRGGSRQKKFHAYRDAIVKRMHAVFPADSFAKKKGKKNRYVQYFLNELSAREDAFEKTLKGVEFGIKNQQKFAGTEKFWDGLKNRSEALSVCYNFSDEPSDPDGKVKDGFFQRDVKHLKTGIDETVKGTKYLEEAGFWNNRAEFKKQFAQTQKDGRKAVSDLSREVDRLESFLDSKWGLGDEAFEERFGCSRMQAGEHLEKMRRHLNDVVDRYTEFWQDDYYDKWEKRFKDPATRGEALNDISIFAEFRGDEGFIEKLEKKADDIRRDLSEQEPKFTNVSLYDIYMMFKGYFEKREEDWQSRSKMAVATLGEAFTDKDSPTNPKFASELKNEQEKEMGENKEALKNLSTGQIKQKFLYKTDDVFMFWACVETLQDRSDLNFRDPFVVATMNRIQKGYFPDNVKQVENMSNVEFQKTLWQWLEKNDVLGRAKANFWTDDWLSDGMKKADDDYASEANQAVENADSFIETVTKSFEDFLSGDPSSVAKTDKGYILAFMRKAIGRRKMNSGIEGDQVIWLLIQGLAIGFFTPADIDKIDSENKAQLPLLTFFKDARNHKKDGRIVDHKLEPTAKKGLWDIADYQIWAKQLNGGKMPRKAADFIMTPGVKERAFKEFYIQNVCASTEFDSSFYEAFVPRIKDSDFSDLSLWAPKFNLKNSSSVLQSTSDDTEKISVNGWKEILHGYPVAIEELWRKYCLEKSLYEGKDGWNERKSKHLQHLSEVIRTSLVFSETLVGNGVFGNRDNAVTLSGEQLRDDSGHMQKRDAIHEIANLFLDDQDPKYKNALKAKVKSKGAPAGVDPADYKKGISESLKDLIERDVGIGVFSEKRVEKFLGEKFGTVATSDLNLIGGRGKVINMNSAFGGAGSKMAA